MKIKLLIMGVLLLLCCLWGLHITSKNVVTTEYCKVDRIDYGSARYSSHYRISLDCGGTLACERLGTIREGSRVKHKHTRIHKGTDMEVALNISFGLIMLLVILYAIYLVALWMTE